MKITRTLCSLTGLDNDTFNIAKVKGQNITIKGSLLRTCFMPLLQME